MLKDGVSGLAKMIEAGRLVRPAEVIDARVPLVELFGYVGTLRSRSEGRGTVSMELSHYDVASA